MAIDLEVAVPLSLAQVRKILSTQFPKLALKTINYISEGGDTYTYEIDQTWIFRFATSATGANKMQREIALLPQLRTSWTIAVPVFDFVGHPNNLYPFPFAGHQKIEGVSGEKLRPHPQYWPAIAAQLGRLLSRLHTFPVATARAYDLSAEPLADADQLLHRVTQFRDRLVEAHPGLMTSDIENYLSGRVELAPASPHQPVVSHADFKGEHLLLSDNGQTLTGVIDWTDICLTDPTVDFGGLMIWLGQTFVRQVFHHYSGPTDEHFIDRSCFYTRCQTLINLGERLAGASDAPLNLLKTQLRWAFSK